jgi:hypothetical protein
MDETTIEARLRKLEDERGILRTLYQYGEGLDYGPEATFLDAFTEDGKWTRLEHAGKHPARSFETHHGLAQMYRDHSHAPEYFHKHVVVNPRIDVDGDSARAVFYLLFICDHPDGPYIRAFSRCRDELVRCADGRWRIKERQAELESTANRDFPPPMWTTLPLVVR